MADYGTKLDVVNTAVNSGTDTAITYSVPIVSFTIKMRGDNGFFWRATNGGTSYFTFQGGEKMESKVLLQGVNYASALLGYIRSMDANDTAEVLVVFEGAVK